MIDLQLLHNLNHLQIAVAMDNCSPAEFRWKDRASALFWLESVHFYAYVKSV